MFNRDARSIYATRKILALDSGIDHVLLLSQAHYKLLIYRFSRHYPLSISVLSKFNLRVLARLEKHLNQLHSTLVIVWMGIISRISRRCSWIIFLPR